MKLWSAQRESDFPDSDSSFRICTFNVLAPMYSRSESSSKNLYPYCAPEHLSFEYRRQLIMREILEVDADVLCIQECSMHFFQYTLTPWLDTDFFLSYRTKASAVGESDGCALAIRRQRFSLIA